MAKATVFLAVITFFLAIFTGGLWYHTYKLVRGAEDAAKIELRAYIGIKDIADEKEGFRITYRNGGLTPAKKVFIRAGYKVDGPGLTKEEIIKRADSFLYRDDIFGIASKDVDRSFVIPIAHDSWPSMRIVDTHVNGIINYKDVFGEKHGVVFQFRVSLPFPNEGWRFTATIEDDAS
jgi:hypothetical protein